MGAPEDKLAELGLTLPEAPAAVAAYVPAVVHGGLVWVSGQVPIRGGELPRRGLVGRDISIGYLAHDGAKVKLYLEESLTFRAPAPEAAVPIGPA